MRYFVAHFLHGNVQAFHERLSRELTLRFRTIPLYERVPSHITLKAPFEADDAQIEEVERILRAFLSSERAAHFRVRGFGHFGFRTIYLDVSKSPEAVSFMRRALATLKQNAPWVSMNPLEGNKLHASVARFLTRRQYRRIQRYLKGVAPEFLSSLDNLAILKKEGKSWKVHSLIAIPHGRGDAYAGYTAPDHIKLLAK